MWTQNAQKKKLKKKNLFQTFENCLVKMKNKKRTKKKITFRNRPCRSINVAEKKTYFKPLKCSELI